MPQPFLLHKSAAFVTRILSVLGIVEAPLDHPGFGGGGSGGGGEGSGREEAVLNVLLRARDGLRDVAKAHPAAAQDVMALSDRCGSGRTSCKSALPTVMDHLAFRI